LHEHAVAKPDSADIRCSFLVTVGATVVPLTRTELMMSSATAAAMLAALATIGERVMVAVWVIVWVTTTRVVEVDVVVDSALVVTVL
jgi:hypothetical protein